MTIQIYKDLEQGTEEWIAARCGLVTASTVNKIVTEVKLEPAKGKVRDDFMYELIAQQLTGYVDVSWIGSNGERGHEEELIAIEEYSKHFNEIDRVGFVTNDEFGFTLGFSPDGLVGDDGMVEVKSRLNKFQIQTIISGEMPRDFYLQVQSGMKIANRKWCDFISISSGLNLVVYRIYRNEEDCDKIITALTLFHEEMLDKKQQYFDNINSGKMRIVPIERITIKETEVEEIY